MLFSGPSLLTMLHGIVLSGGALIGLGAALFALRAMAQPEGSAVPERPARYLAWLTVGTAVLLWSSVIGGTFIVFPIYRTPAPEGVTALAAYPRAFLMSDPGTRWLHAFAMEIKEHMPWIAAMLTTAVAVMAQRHRGTLLADGALRRVASSLLAISFLLVSFVAFLGVLINKVAPVQ